MEAHVAEWKKENVGKLEEVLTSKPVVAMVGIDDIPAKSIQKIRAGLRGKAVVRSGKNNLIKLALENAKAKVKGLDKLEEGIRGQTAIVASDLNPFQLYKEFESSRTMAPARPNQVAPNDIVVKKGDTPFKPGPVVGDLQQAGIPAAIEQGKVVIKKDSTVVKAGEAISPALASALEKLEIYPIEIGLDVRGVFEDGVVYQGDVLAIDEDAFRGQLATAISNATALAVDRAWVTPHTIPILLGNAARNALALGIEAAFLTKETVDPILAKAYNQMLALARLASGEALDDELQAALGAAAEAAPAAADEGSKAEEKEEEAEEEEETVSEEEAAEGLGALFD